MDERSEYPLSPTVPNSDRRSFLSAALATVTVAAVTGGTAALLLEDDGTSSAIINEPSPTSRPPAISAPIDDTPTLRAQLAALESENSALRGGLDAAQKQLAAYQGAGAQSSAGEEWRLQFEEANAQATDLAGRLTTVQGLLALYEELDAVDLANVASGGIAAVGGVLGDLIAEVPLVTEGLSAGRAALDEFEEQLPLVEQGRYWLEGQMRVVGSTLEKAELALNNALEAGGTLMQLLNRWFEEILKWLPFGIGERALAITAAIGDVVAKVPETLDGLQANVAGPLDMWLERDGDESRLQRRLIKPVREDAIERADSTVSRLASVKDVYEEQLRAPVADLASRQSLIRQQIAQYRQSHLV